MSAVIYFEHPHTAAEVKTAADDLAVVGALRLANANFHAPGEVEYKGKKSVKGKGMLPTMFDEVFVTAGCSKHDQIAEAYKAHGIEVKVFGERPKADGDKPKRAKRAVPKKTAEDLGWKLKGTPKAYLKRNPKGSQADLAAKIVAELED